MGEKIDAIIDETVCENMTLISGIPPWAQMYFERIVKKTKKKIKDVFPNYKLFIYGGVNFEPYKSRFIDLVGKKVDSIETYPASEGFIAYQDKPYSPVCCFVLIMVYFMSLSSQAGFLMTTQKEFL